MQCTTTLLLSQSSGLVVIGEAIHHEVLPDVFTTDRGDRSSKGRLEGGTEAQQENRNPEGLGGGCASLGSRRP